MSENQIDKPFIHEWVTRVRGVLEYHAKNLKENPAWTLKDTARDLHRSVGRISEDLMLARYMRTHPRVETYSRIQDAVAYCRKIKRQQRLNV